MWAAGQGAVAWYYTQLPLSKVGAAVFGGLLAGWLTAAVVGRFARWGTGVKFLVLLGILFGVAFSSGAVAGLSALFSLWAWWWYEGVPLVVNWDQFLGFILSTAAIPAAVLGLITGLYVSAVMPRADKKK